MMNSSEHRPRSFLACESAFRFLRRAAQQQNAGPAASSPAAPKWKVQKVRFLTAGQAGGLDPAAWLHAKRHA